MIRTTALALALVAAAPATGALAWDGTDENGNAIEIGRGELVRRGRDIEVFNYGTGQYSTYSVESIRRSGRSVEIEAFDNESGEYKTFEMDE